MRLRVGTSGFSYPEWKGTFYPEDLKNADMLRYYAERLNAVEINNTFYRMPKADVVASWYEQVPDSFHFALKASQRITHKQRLVDCGDAVTYLFKITAILKEKLGPVLFQLPPYLKKDRTRLADFLAILPEGCRAAFEFRDGSWLCDEIYATLEKHGAALCISDMDDGEPPPLVKTSDWGCLRLRRTSYADPELENWRTRIEAQNFSVAYVFFKHELKGPEYCRRFLGVDSELVPESPASHSAAGPGLAKGVAEPTHRARSPGRRSRLGTES